MRNIFRYMVLFGLLLATAGAILTAGLFWHYSKDLPEVESLADFSPRQVNRIYSSDGYIIGEFGPRRTIARMEEMPPLLPNAFVAAEDEDFYQHEGVSLPHIVVAMIRNVLSMRVRQGASTITQQVIKNLLLTHERSFKRKIREAILAYRIESTLEKRQILEIYLNSIYFGNGCYGVAEAARFYFSKELAELDVGQIAYLAGLPKNPGGYRLNRHPERAKKRQLYVLRRLQELDYINQAEYQRFTEKELLYKPSQRRAADAPYVEDLVLRSLREKLGSAAIARGGLKVYTSIDSRMQKAAQNALRRGLLDFDRRHGYRPTGIVLDQEERALWRSLFSGYPEDGLFAFTAERRPPPLEEEVENLAGEKAEETGESQIDKKAATPPPWRTRIERVKKERIFWGFVEKRNDKGALEIELGSKRGTVTAKQVAQTIKSCKNSDASKCKPASLFAQGALVQFMLSANSSDKDKPSLEIVSIPEVQGALVAMEPEARKVRALVGGFSFNIGEFNRAVRARRQPGSSFKPFTYLTAIKSRKYTAASIVQDEPLTIRQKGAPDWKPANFDHKHRGKMRLREALAHSVNIVAARLIADVGPLQVIETAQALGIESPLQNNHSLALGTSEVTPYEMASAYAGLASLGKYSSPDFLEKVIGPDDAPLLEFPHDSRQAVDSAEVYVLVSMMESVVDHGTARRAKVLKRPLAGKTGTASQMRDAWFAGFAPQLACAVWVGYDNHKPLGRGETGSRVALPIWVDFMAQAQGGFPHACRCKFCACG